MMVLTKSLGEWRRMVKKDTCGMCRTLLPYDISYYDHPHGFNVTSFISPQWLYIVCNSCHYQWALHKLGVRGYTT